MQVAKREANTLFNKKWLHQPLFTTGEQRCVNILTPLRSGNAVVFEKKDHPSDCSTPSNDR
jgi:hypothetical protein